MESSQIGPLRLGATDAPSAAVPIPDPATAGAAPAAQTFQNCDQCGAPLDDVQRYCVSCGAHRPAAVDPAARFLSLASARARAAREQTAAGRSARTDGGSYGLVTLLVLALLPIVAAAGVLIGRSSNNQDGRLIQELALRQSAASATTPATGGAATPVATATTPSAAKGTTKPAASAGKFGKSGKSGKRSSTHTGAGRAKAGKTSGVASTSSTATSTTASTTSTTSAAKPSASQAQQGASATKKVQKSTGKSYVNGQSNLPGTVVVP
jgi:hypothetical protein